MRHSWYTFKREDKSDVAFLSIKQKGDMGFSKPVQFTDAYRCDDAILKLPYLSGFVQWQLANGEDHGYRVKMADRTLRLLGFDERTVKNAIAEEWPA